MPMPYYGSAGRQLRYFNFYVDGTPVREMLSFAKDDEGPLGPKALLEALTKDEPQGAKSESTRKMVEDRQRFIERARLEEPSRLGYGPIGRQWAAVQDLLLQGQPPVTQRRCRLFGCPGCPCHAVTAIIELVDGCYVWHSFQSDHGGCPETTEVAGGPFFFERAHYVETLLGAFEWKGSGEGADRPG